MRAQELLLHKKLPLGHASAVVLKLILHGEKLIALFLFSHKTPKLNLTFENRESGGKKWLLTTQHLQHRKCCWQQLYFLWSINCFCIGCKAAFQKGSFFTNPFSIMYPSEDRSLSGRRRLWSCSGKEEGEKPGKGHKVGGGEQVEVGHYCGCALAAGKVKAPCCHITCIEYQGRKERK